jgi:hypothetical protein
VQRSDGDVELRLAARFRIADGPGVDTARFVLQLDDDLGGPMDAQGNRAAKISARGRALSASTVEVIW